MKFCNGRIVAYHLLLLLIFSFLVGFLSNNYNFFNCDALIEIFSCINLFLVEVENFFLSNTNCFYELLLVLF